MAILATIGVIDTASITFNKWGWIGTLSCPGETFECDKVLNSAWGTIFENDIFSIPLSFIGLLSYLIILIMVIIPLFNIFKENNGYLIKNNWQIIFTLSCGMSVFSLVLIWLMIFKINAFCLFCILSAFLSILLLILSVVGGTWEDYRELLLKGFLLSFSILIISLIWSNAVDPKRSVQSFANNQEEGIPPRVKSSSDLEKIALAKHLRKKGAIMFSAYWCPHCHDQKEMFGKEAVQELKIIECAKNGKNNRSDLCELKAIEGYPSWEINGEIISGVQSLKDLSELSNY